MEQERLIASTTILLSMAAGFCDTATFVSANEIFSAHVTGNFVLFAYNIVKHVDGDTWIKLLTFPIFVIAIITGEVIAKRSDKKYMLLLIEGVLLLSVGLTAILHHPPTTAHTQDIISLIFVAGIVFAMGLQNCFGKLFAKMTFGPTTIMTGNVTQASLDLGSALMQRFKDATIFGNIMKDSSGIVGFLIGCLLGGFAGHAIGLQSVALPGIAILIYCMIVAGQKGTT